MLSPVKRAAKRATEDGRVGAREISGHQDNDMDMLDLAGQIALWRPAFSSTNLGALFNVLASMRKNLS